jgi:tetratricopeptide (TPR) repeat protein
MRSRFEMGTLLAERGDLAAARRAYAESIDLAHEAGDVFQEVVSHNNAAYHALLDGDLADAHVHLDAAFSLAETHALVFPLQYLYSTRGETALAEGRPDEAETWFLRSVAEAESHDNAEQAANSRANLGLAAQARGEYATALALLTAARAATPAGSRYLQTQIDLWLTKLHLDLGDAEAAGAALSRAEQNLEGSGYVRLGRLAVQMRARLQPAGTG